MGICIWKILNSITAIKDSMEHSKMRLKKAISMLLMILNIYASKGIIFAKEMRPVQTKETFQVEQTIEKEVKKYIFLKNKVKKIKDGKAHEDEKILKDIILSLNSEIDLLKKELDVFINNKNASGDFSHELAYKFSKRIDPETTRKLVENSKKVQEARKKELTLEINALESLIKVFYMMERFEIDEEYVQKQLSSWTSVYSIRPITEYLYEMKELLLKMIRLNYEDEDKKNKKATNTLIDYLCIEFSKELIKINEQVMKQKGNLSEHDLKEWAYICTHLIDRLHLYLISDKKLKDQVTRLGKVLRAL